MCPSHLVFPSSLCARTRGRFQPLYLCGSPLWSPDCELAVKYLARSGGNIEVFHIAQGCHRINRPPNKSTPNKSTPQIGNRRHNQDEQQVSLFRHHRVSRVDSPKRLDDCDPESGSSFVIGAFVIILSLVRQNRFRRHMFC